MDNKVRLQPIQTFLRLARCAAFWLLVCVPAVGVAQTCPPEPPALTSPQLTALMKEAKDHGFLWRIAKDGRVGHLFGTIHLGKPDWMVPGPKTLAALMAADVVALELDVLDPAIQAQFADPSKSGIKPLRLPPALQARMSALARKVCAPEAVLPKMHPILQLVTVTVNDARFSELEAVYGSEVFLAGFARGAGKPVISLETAELQLRALMHGEAKDILEGVDRAMAVLENGKTRVATARLVRAWANGDLAELENYATWCECADTDQDRKALVRLNDDRNGNLAAGIDKIMRGGQSVFAAVGALHMVGPKALPGLLREMGYKVERVTPAP